MGGTATAGLQRSSFPSDEAYLQAFRETYRKAFERFYPFVADMGFHHGQHLLSMSVGENVLSSDLNPVYSATSKAPLVHFSRPEKAVLFETLLETLPRFRDRIRVFSPQCSLYSLYRQYSSDGATPYPAEAVQISSSSTRTPATPSPAVSGEMKTWEGFGTCDRTRTPHPSACTRCDWNASAIRRNSLDRFFKASAPP